MRMVMNKAFSGTLVELARMRAKSQPESIAYRFISRDGGDDTLTYAQLDEKARAIAAQLILNSATGKRALLLYLPGLDYIAAFFGCLYAGVVAVPAYPPDPQRISRTLPRLLNIIKDSESSVIMSSSFIEAMAKDLFINEEQKELKWLSTDKIQNSLATKWKEPKINKNSLAFLQYTSGSTSDPRGVMLTHENLLCNLQLIEKELPKTKHRQGVAWLPPYHDMGLIGGILQPMQANFPVVLMSPIDFLIEPFVWLKAVAKYKATLSGGPNFAYELCLKRITSEQKKTLDLSSWNIAANGAEPIRHDTMEKFADAFAECGFKKTAFFPCYGLAEATLYVCGSSKAKSWESINVDTKALENGLVKKPLTNQSSRTLVSSGNPLNDQELLIVDKDKKIRLKENMVGEIWYRHPSVAQGYFNQPEKTKETFGAYLANKEGPFLRTGDLGFINKNELYITGRAKDAIIIRGRNLYPQDIEKTVEESHNNIRFGCIAAFAIEVKEQEELAIVCEIKQPELATETLAAIRNAIAMEQGIRVHTIALIEAKSIAKTSSGKIQRHACKEMLKTSTLDLVELWTTDQKEKIKQSIKNTKNTSSNQNKTISPAIKKCVIEVLGLKNVKTIKTDETLVAYGLDSLMRQELIGALENLVKKPLTNLVIDENTSIKSLATALEKFKLETTATKKISKIKKSPEILPQFINFKDFPLYVALKEQLNNLEAFGLKNPFFTEHEGLVLDTTTVNGQKLINFSNYNYIGMAGHPEVSTAAKNAIDLYGTSVSASRLVSGERHLHVNLEKKIAEWIGVDDSIVYVSGHSTNVSTIGHLFEKGDLIVYDSLSHNSIQMGCKLSDAKAIPFPHNDYLSLDYILKKHRNQHNRVLIVIEGVYSMDGDIPDLSKYVEIKKRHQAFLMVDEAHSMGVLGKNGRGLAEYAHVSPCDVDLWMGTLSKSFASCGGYIAGCKELIDYLRYSSPAFVYSVGLSPPNAAASLKAIEILANEPERVEKLKNNSETFLSLCKENKLDTGLSKNSPIIPIIVGNSMKCLMLSERLLESGINVLPIIYPAVEDHLSRLRFFITSCHNENQIKDTVKTLTKEISACASL